jgi:uncharacterized protein YegL
MGGEKIDEVNKAMHSLESQLKNLAQKNPTAAINVRVITFGGTQASWHIKDRISAEDFKHRRIEISGPNALTPFGSAMNLLNQTLADDKMPKSGYRPLIILLSDGRPNDAGWEEKIEAFHKLKWGQKAIKLAYAIGSNASKSTLEKFTGDPECVFEGAINKIANFITIATTYITASVNPSKADDVLGIIRKKPDSTVKESSSKKDSYNEMIKR